MRYTTVGVWLATLAFGIASGRPSRIIAAAPEQIIVVRADQIGTKVQILGRLGTPMGTMMTVRGVWHRRISAEKPALGLEFHVTDVDDRGLPQSVVFLPDLIEVLGKTNVKPEEGAIWELRAFETGQFRNTVERHWKEFYGEPRSPRDWGQGSPFVSELTGIIKGVRREGDDRNNAKNITDAGETDKPRY